MNGVEAMLQRIGRQRSTVVLIAAALACGALSPSPAPAQPFEAVPGGGLLVAPTRVVFEGRLRTAEITLLNTGPETATYRISLTRMRMREDGSFEEVDSPEAGERFADDLVRYSPRQVTLEPEVPQTVRIQLRKPADLETGEYRTHLLFRALPVLRGVGPGPAGSASGNGVDIRLTPIYGVSIPILVRHGPSTVAIAIEDLRLDRVDGTRIGLTIRRRGNRSAHGTLEVWHVPALGAEERIARMKGLAVYVPNRHRRVEIPVADPGRLLPGGSIRAVFTPTDRGSSPVIAEIDVR